MSTTRAGTVYTRNMEELHEGEPFQQEPEREGNFYQEVAEEGHNQEIQANGAQESISAMVRMFLEDSRRREEEQAVERQRWLAEKRAWEIAQGVERQRRDEEMRRREEHTQKQMELLKNLVQGVQMQGEAATKRADNDKDVRVPKLTEEDDIVAYLTTFERLMRAYEVKAERWAFKLATNLIGKAQQAYAAMSPEDAVSYEKLKEAILKRYNITEESYRQRLRVAKRKPGESGQEFVARLDDLAAKWLKSCRTAAEVQSKIVLEQFLNTLPEDVRVFVKERNPESAGAAGKLADDFVQARKPEQARKEERRDEKRDDRRSDKKICSNCGKLGHFAKDCRVKLRRVTSTQAVRPRRDLQDIECFNCHAKGHYSSNCPRNAMFCMERRMNTDGSSFVVKGRPCEKPGVTRRGLVEGRRVQDILLDTGCSRTLVRRNLVPDDKIVEGSAVAIRCAHGDTVLYPLARIAVEVDGRQMDVEAAVSDTLPMSVLFGTDNPELSELLESSKPNLQSSSVSQETDEAFVVSTRAQKKKEDEEEEKKSEAARDENVQPHSLEEEREEEDDCSSTTWMQQLDEEVFGQSKEKQKKTRKEKRLEKLRRQELEKQIETEAEAEENQLSMARFEKHPMDISLEEIKELQATDPTLRDVRIAVKESESREGIGFFARDGLFYRRWTPRDRNKEMEVEQLVLPKPCRHTVMKVAHSVPLGGHLGRNKTTDRILQRFYWPTMHKDIAKFCKSCEACQRVSEKGVKRAPLIPLPVVSQPFERIAMDIVGPLPKSRKGNRFILVICDYATRYPEAFPLKHIDAASVAEELLKLFSRVGVPKEILTDQGTNFTSKLLVELYRLLHVQPIKTTPYHPQTDGLVERFNRTLKLMLRKANLQEGTDWDTLLPYLLFSYREVPQASTGFSPFELLYGRQVRGPLDILKETWQSSEKSEESVVSHILSIREKMEKMQEIAGENLQKAQKQQKEWYDRSARKREFQPGDLVLLLLPTSANKMLAQWQGPYKVIKRISKVDYLIEMPEKQRKKGVYHVNLLKKWEEEVRTCYLADEVQEDEFPDWRPEKSTQLKMGEQLTAKQRHELAEILEEFKDVIQNKPGHTTLVEHAIKTNGAQPVRQAPYRIPHAHREAVNKELNEMEKSGIIEPSVSEWASPVVIVKKKDGNIRICIDYRKLNSLTPMDAYPMPRVDELIDKLGQAKYITTLDLTRGYWQVPMAREDKAKTAFITPRGLYQFTVMPFGLNGAPATFQRMMDSMLRGMEDFSSAYIDDIEIYSKTWEEHIKHFVMVLTRLRENNLTVKPVKCQFGMKECSYLGYIVENGQVKPDPAKIQAVREYPKPTTKKQIRVFLGLTGYYRRFIARYAEIAAPLTDLTKKALPDKLNWTPKCEVAFATLKEELTHNPILVNPDFTKEFILQTDASDRGVGAVLSQQDESGKDHPIAYYSRKLLPREERYSTVEKECLAIKLGVEAFKVYLIGKKFTIQTDHRSLVWLNRLKEKNSRLTRWSLALQQYEFTIQHRAGSANCNADALSRATTDSSTTSLLQKKEGEM